MRALRGFLAAAVIGSVLAIPSAAGANGGAYISFDRTHYLPGDSATASSFVYIPQEEQKILDSGPFYGFLMPAGTRFKEGRSIPEAAINLGPISIGPTGAEDEFELRLTFTVPDVPTEFYDFRVCNLPCTVSGLREPLSGFISIVGTRREGQLISQQWTLEGKVATLTNRLERAQRGKRAYRELADLFGGREAELASEVDRLTAELAAAQQKVAPSATKSEPVSRPVISDRAVAGVTIGLLLLAGAIVFRRRRPPAIHVPDTLEELDPRVEAPVER